MYEFFLFFFDGEILSFYRAWSAPFMTNGSKGIDGTKTSEIVYLYFIKI